MNTLLPAISLVHALSTGQSVFVGICSFLALACAVAVAFSRRAVHAAVYMMAMMISLAGIYFALGAEFLGAVQIVVYTGAIMMMFLFVIMLVGVQAVDSPRETKVATVAASLLLVIAFGIIALVAGVKTTIITQPGMPPHGTNPVSIAFELIHTYYLPMEIVATLLIVAAVGAMTLTHSDSLLPRLTQRFIAAERMKAYKERGVPLGQQVPPGVYAETNALDVPAINGETARPEPSSILRAVRIRGADRSLGEASPWTARTLAMQASGAPGLHGTEANASVGRSGAWGMPGEPAPQIDTAAHPPALPPGEPHEDEATAKDDAAKKGSES